MSSLATQRHGETSGCKKDNENLYPSRYFLNSLFNDVCSVSDLIQPNARAITE